MGHTLTEDQREALEHFAVCATHIHIHKQPDRSTEMIAVKAETEYTKASQTVSHFVRQPVEG